MTLPIRDIHLPDAPSMWPPAIGWWLLAGVLLLALIIALRWWWLKRKRHAQQERILSDYDQLIDAADNPEQALQLASQYLRRVCLKHAPHAAHLSDEEWLHFVDQTHGETNYFLTSEGVLLRDGPFQAHLNADSVSAVTAEVRRVIQTLVHHHA